MRSERVAIIFLCLIGMNVLGQSTHQPAIDLLWDSMNIDKNHHLDKEELIEFFLMKFGAIAAVIGIQKDHFADEWTKITHDPLHLSQYWFDAMDFNHDFVLTTIDANHWFAFVDDDQNQLLTKADEFDPRVGEIYDGYKGL